MNRYVLTPIVAFCALVLCCAYASAQATVSIALLRQGNLYFVQRPVQQATPELAALLLMQGPSLEEAAIGVTTSIPDTWTLESAHVQGNYLVVDLGGVPAGTFYSDITIDDVLLQFSWTARQFDLDARVLVSGEPISVLRHPQPEIEQRSVPLAPPGEPLPSGPLSGKKICLSAGHGYFWNGSSWLTQRPVYCAPLSNEDFHNVVHAIMLKAYLEAEGATVIDTREMNKNRGTSPHASKPWWQLAAPPYLYDRGYPVSVYAPLTGAVPGTPGVDQTTEDRRTRPNASNYDGADLFVSLHTNGYQGNCYGTTCPSGLEMYYSSTKVGAASYNFAKTLQVSCSSAVISYWGSWPCRNSCNPRDNAFTEIYYPTAPACLLEFGFHDSCDTDGAYLLDPLFTSAGMYGIYAGICQYLGVSPTYDGYSAEYVSDTIPATVLQGETRSVSITLRNRGVAWNENHQFRLGAVGDSDPFAATRHHISGVVMPAGTYTFTFNMTFPTVGTFVTDWRMLREGVTWFGDTVSKTVEVLPSNDTEPPTVPQNLRVTGKTETTVSIAWDASTDNVAVQGYQVYRDGSPIDTTSNLFYNDSGLSPDTGYDYQVRAYDYIPNYSALSGVLRVVTDSSDTTPPTVPQNLRVTGATQTSISLTWDPSTDNKAVAGYRVYRDGVVVHSTANTFFNDTGRSPNTSYNYQVEAYDAAPNYSGPSGILVAMTLAGLFSDGFDGNLDNWVLDPVNGSTPLTYSTAQNHGSLPGAGSALVPNDGVPHFMFRWLDTNAQSLTSGGYKTGMFTGWLYDTAGPTGSMRTGLRVYAYDTSGVARAIYWAGVYAAQNQANYIGAVHDGSAWTYYPLGARSIGWHKLQIEILPHTGANDVRFYLDSAQAATGSQPAGAASANLKRMYIGFNYSSNGDVYYDDVTFDSPAPAAPSGLAGSGLSTTSVRWNFTDNATNEIGARIYDGALKVAEREVADTTYADEGGLIANTVYSRTAKAYAGVLESAASAAGTGCTLSIPPSASTVTCSKPTGVWQNANPFQFTAVGGFGAGRVSYYTTVWDQSPTHVWTGDETTWISAFTNRYAAASARPWYFHVRGFNQYNEPNGTLTLGPYYFDDTPPAAPAVADDGDTTSDLTSLSASWSAADAESGIEGYQYAIGTTAGGTDVVDWTTPSPQTAVGVTHSGLTLVEGQTYYFSVRARNAAQLWSSVGSSDGILAQIPTVSILEAKGLEDGSDIRISGRVVSAVFDGAFYIQESGRTSGIRVVSAAVVQPGDVVVVVGKVQTVDGERYVSATSVVVN